MAMSFLIHVTQGDPSLLVFTKAVDLEGMAYTSAPTNTCMGSKHETKTHTPRRSGVCETRTPTHVQTQTDTHARTHHEHVSDMNESKQKRNGDMVMRIH